MNEKDLRASALRLFAYLKPYFWPHFAGAIVCMLIYSATSGAVPFLVHHLVDDVLDSGDESVLRLMSVLLISVFGVRALVHFGHEYLGEYVGQHIVFDVRDQLNRKIQHLPVSYFDNISSGSVLSRMTTDVLLLRQAITEGATVIIRDASSFVILLAVTFYLDATLALITFVVFPAVILPLQVLSKRMRRLSHKGLDTLGSLAALLQETLLGNRVVKAFGMESYEQERFEAESHRLLKTNMRAARIKAFTTPMTEMFAAVGIAVALWYGGSSVIGGGRTNGSFLAFLSALVLLYDPFKRLVRANNVIQTGVGAAWRIFEVLDLADEDATSGATRGIDGLRDAISFEDVSFAYNDDLVLKGASIEIKAGQVLALVGSSGGGKSTIADLIPRFYEVSSGRITIDGVDIREVSLCSLRAQMAVVTQFTFLFNDTIRNNIAYGSVGTSEESVVAAAEAANVHEFICSLPAGYDTVVGELGVQLSGGQRQRLAIARALLKNAPILILDEATSALDTESERLVQDAIEALMRGRTTLVIAHRLTTIREADQIAVVESGRIVEVGTHAQLLANGQRYKRLHEMQFREEGPTADGEPATDS